MCFQFRNIKEIKILRLQGSNKSSGQMFPVGASWPLEQSETISFYLFIIFFWSSVIIFESHWLPFWESG